MYRSRPRLRGIGQTVNVADALNADACSTCIGGVDVVTGAGCLAQCGGVPGVSTVGGPDLSWLPTVLAPGRFNPAASGQTMTGWLNANTGTLLLGGAAFLVLLMAVRR